MKKVAHILGLLAVLTGCAVDRVKEVNTPDEANSLYKVPVVYSIGLAENSPPISSTNITSIVFAEYDPVAKRGTSSCLGSADTIVMSLWPDRNQNPPKHNLHYHVLMVPPGYYALSWGGITPHEANPSLYIKIEDNGPQYLGDFWVVETPSTNPKYPWLSKASTLPVEYHQEQAKQALQSLNIPFDQLQQATLIPTDGMARGFVMCTP